MAINKAEAALMRVIGSRMTEARHLCQYNRDIAANLLMVKPSLLRRVETALDLKYIPLNLVYRASQLYDVSLDYIFGESDDFELALEVQAERAFGVQMQTYHQSQLCELGVRFAGQERKQKALAETVKSVLYATTELEEVMLQFKKMNANFNIMACSSKLNHRVNKLVRASDRARLELVRCKALPLNFLPENKNYE